MLFTTSQIDTLIDAVHKARGLLARSRKACTPCQKRAALALEAENALIEALEAIGQLPGQANKGKFPGMPNRAGIEHEDTQLSQPLGSFWNDLY